ncbi:hypothetical protein Trydic_g12375 [Trypoxylus dichotomus]
MSKSVVFVLFLAASATAPATQLVDQETNRVGNFRIYGGTDAPDGAYPFMVSLRTSQNRPFCGGSIITERWVLTAGNCVFGRDASNVIAVAGTNTLNFSGVFKEACKIVIHPNFNDTGHLSNDIAMVLLKLPFEYSRLITPAIISYDLAEHKINVTMIGWGKTVFTSDYSKRLQEFSGETISRAHCETYYIGMLSPKNMCTKYQRRKGFCYGDAGGPLFQTDNKEQIGIASFHYKRGCGIKPDVYTKLAPYTGWIQDTIRSMKHRC